MFKVIALCVSVLVYAVVSADIAAGAPPPPCAPVLNTSSIVVHHCLHDYLLVDCSLPMSTGTVTVLRCQEGYKFPDGRPTTHVTCLETGRWSEQTISCVQAPPPPCAPVLNTSSIVVHHCLHDYLLVDCSLPMSTGTVTVFGCQEGYKFPDGRPTTHVTCLGTGRWSEQTISCVQAVQECGRQSVSSTLVVRGETVVGGQLPWHVTIYGGLYSYSAGTLISATHVVISAYYVSVGDSNTPHPASKFTLTAGQLIRHSTPADEPLQQTRGVRSVLLHPQYTGGRGAAHDIALLVANASFVITPAVNVACVDWSGLFPAPTASDVIIVAANKQGTVDTAHHVTAAHSYTPVAAQQCRERADERTRSYITEDRLCAAPTNNAACADHWGAGLMVERDTGGARQYYLTGVWSVALAWTSGGGCDYNRLSGFTNVTQHIGWLQQHVSPPT